MAELYEGNIFRPPSEAYSILLQVAVGCSHNKCTFCNSYRDKKFHLRTLEDIKENLWALKNYYGRGEKVFLTDGDALCLNNKKLLAIISEIYKVFPECKRICSYGSAKDILNKSVDELKELKAAGMDIIYVGCESGCDEVLKRVQKSGDRDALIRAIKRLREAGLRSSVTFISGLGGKELWCEHAIDSASLINESNPDYVSFLTLQMRPGAPIIEEIENGSFQLLSSGEVLDELELVFENLHPDGPCIFRSNHASNYLVLAGTLPDDTSKLIAEIRAAKSNPNMLRPESLRAL